MASQARAFRAQLYLLLPVAQRLIHRMASGRLSLHQRLRSVEGTSQKRPCAPSSAGPSPAKKKVRSHIGEPDIQDSDDDDMDAGSSVQQVPAGKQCVACARVTGRDRSFVDPSRGFAWLYSDGRGEWCRDCATVYRSRFRGIMTMGSFHRFG